MRISGRPWRNGPPPIDLRAYFGAVQAGWPHRGASAWDIYLDGSDLFAAIS